MGILGEYMVQFADSSFSYQLGIMDCGPACLKSIAKHYGKHYSLTYLSDLCGITNEGVSMAGIMRAAEIIGFRSLAVKCTLEELENKIPLPSICHWKNEHFIIVYKIVKKRVGSEIYVADPAKGLVCYDILDFKEKWLSDQNGERKGVALLLEPEINTRNSSS